MGGGMSKRGGAGAMKILNEDSVRVENHTEYFTGLSKDQPSVIVRRGNKVELKFQAPADADLSQPFKALFGDCQRRDNTRALTFEIISQDERDFHIRIDFSKSIAFGAYALQIQFLGSGQKQVCVVTCNSVFLVLYNPFKADDAQVYMEDAAILADVVTRQNDAILVGCETNKTKRVWRCGQNDPFVVEATLLICSRAPKSIIANSKEMVTYISESIAPLVLDYIAGVNQGKGIETSLSVCQSFSDLLRADAGGFRDFIISRYPVKSKTNSSIFESELEEDEDDIFAQEMGLKKFESIDDMWILPCLLISILRVIGIPCRPVTLFNLKEKEGDTILKGEKGHAGEPQSPVLSPSDSDAAQLSLFKVCVEVWLEKEWHVLQFNEVPGGGVSVALNNLHTMPTTLRDQLNPKIRITGLDQVQPVLLKSSAWACCGQGHELLNRTSYYSDATVDNSNGTVQSTEKLTSFIKGSGSVGDPVMLCLEGSVPTGKTAEYTMVVNAISSTGKHLKLLRTFTGSGSGAIHVSRTLEFEDLVSHVERAVPSIEVLTTVKLIEDNENVLSPVGEAVGDGDYQLLLFYEPFAFRPRSLEITAQKWTEPIEVEVLVVNRLNGASLSFKELKTCQCSLPDPRQPRRIRLGTFNEERFHEMMDEFGKYVFDTNYTTLKADETSKIFPWVLTWHDKLLQPVKLVDNDEKEIEEI